MKPGAVDRLDPAHPAVARATQMGHALELLIQTERRELTIAAVDVWLSTPIRLEQILFLFAPAMRPLAYATWAFLHPDTAAALRNGKLPFLQVTDWNDGCDLWLIDVVAPFGHALPLLRQLQRRLSSSHAQVRAFRQDAAGNPERILRLPAREPC